MRTIDGALQVADIANSAYMKHHFKDTSIVSGVGFFPFLTDIENSA
jgi:hypothetical protein